MNVETFYTDAKINLTLRVTGRISDGPHHGYHELCSVFLRLPSVERLDVQTLQHGDMPDLCDAQNLLRDDFLKVNCAWQGEPLSGRNILSRTLEQARKSGFAVPPLDMTLHKTVPPGTGMGCGSGDAAALLECLERQNVLSPSEAGALAPSIGADVPFFLARRSNGTKLPAAVVTGIGDIMEPLPLPTEGLTVMTVIPAWRCLTAETFAQLDRRCVSNWPLTGAEARQEALNLMRSLFSHREPSERVGLLPNDFLPFLMEQHGAEYTALFEAFDRANATAWGVSGSGSSAFAVWRMLSIESVQRRAQVVTQELPWIESTHIFAL